MEILETQVKPSVDIRTLGALLFEWAIIGTIISICVRSQSVALWITGAIILATRQHALLMLYHDAVHGMVAKNAKLNDFIINLLVGVPFLLPVEIFRPLHLSHHRQLGREQDPERTILFANQHWKYQALPIVKLIRQIIADLFLLNAVKTIMAWKRDAQKFHLNPVTLIAVLGWIGLMGIILVNVSTTMAALIVAIWILPMFTLTNLLQKIRSFAEHGGATDYTDENHYWTYSWRVGLIGRLTVWPYNINRHREHHAKPNIPWHRLPEQAQNSALDLDSAHLLWHLVQRKRDKSDAAL